MFRNRAIVAIMIALALVASACGGGDSTSDDPTSTTTTTAAGGGDGGDATTTTTEADPVSGDSGSSYCERVRDAEASNDSPLDFGFFGRTPAQLEAQFEANLKIFEQWKDVAPREIEDDVEVVFNFYKMFVDRANELEWNLEAMADDEVFNTAFDDPALETAGDNIDKYTLDVCGVDFSVSADPGTAPPGGDDVGDDPITIALNAFQLPADLFSVEDIECIREEVGSEFEATITPGWLPGQNDITVLLAALDTCELSLTP